MMQRIASERRYSMDYEVIGLQRKIIVGVNARTSNDDPKMGEIIGSLWDSLYNKGLIGKIKNRANAYSYGLYSDYDNDGYQVTVGCEVTKVEERVNQEGLAAKIIPEGKYARFQIHGDMVNAVSEAWRKIWKLELDRTYTGDFEEYVDSDMNGNATIYIYIAIR
jgi:predicted transcriptional regulator YdeE